MLEDLGQWLSQLGVELLALDSVKTRLAKDKDVPGKVRRQVLETVDEVAAEVKRVQRELKQVLNSNLPVHRFAAMKKQLATDYTKLKLRLEHFHAMTASPSTESQESGLETPTEFLTMKTQLVGFKKLIKAFKAKAVRHSHAEISSALIQLAGENNKVMKQLSYLQEEQGDMKASLRDLRDRLDTYEARLEYTPRTPASSRSKTYLTPRSEAVQLLTRS